MPAPSLPIRKNAEEQRVKIGVVAETRPDERRVALTPAKTAKLCGLGHEVLVERGAGSRAHFDDEQYERSGATLVDEGAGWGAQVVVKVAPPSDEETSRLVAGTVLIGFLYPLRNGPVVQAIAASGATSLAMDMVPRISRAQAMDALSSQANLAGYRAVIVGAGLSGKVFPMMSTAAGQVRPATVLVLGAGVAGLQAIATAKRLGAIVQASDVRAATREQVESVGGRFLEFDLGGVREGGGGYAAELDAQQQRRQQELMVEAIAKVDIVVTTALVPGGQAPILVSDEAVQRMRPGSVIVDLAGEAGGNCALTEPGQTIERHGVTITAPTNLPSTMPAEASELYARNITELLGLITSGPELRLDFEDEIIAGACVTRGGQIVHAAARAAAER
jgi:H+-translocating NAD(P) transhydrogenase subunit alpha